MHHLIEVDLLDKWVSSTYSWISAAIVDIAKMARLKFYDGIFTDGGFPDLTGVCGGPIFISIKLTEYG